MVNLDRLHPMTRLFFSSSSYPADAEDWKGRFIADMLAALAARPDFDVSVWAPPGALPPGVVDVTTESDRAWLGKLMASGGIAAQLRRGKVAGLANAWGLLARLYRAYRRGDADLVHVNWLQNVLPLWGTRVPALVTVLGSDYGLLDRPGMAAALRAVFRQRRTMLAPNADWMRAGLESRFGDVAEVVAVPFGVDARWFRIDRTQAERGLWIAVTRITRNKIGDLFDWGDGLFGAGRQLHLFGPMQENMTLPGWVTWHGPTHPAELRESWFPRANGLITLSRHDEGRPQVMLEAMAAGMPIIASDLPAHRDFIVSGDTGMLAGSRDAFAQALDALKDMESSWKVGSSARRWVKDAIGDWDDCAQRYAALYERILAK